MRPVSRSAFFVLVACVLGVALACGGAAGVMSPAVEAATSRSAAQQHTLANGAAPRTFWKRWVPQRELYQGLRVVKGPGGELYGVGTVGARNFSLRSSVIGGPPGESDSRLYIARYSSAGALAWSHLWTPAAGTGVGVRDVVVDRAGSVYLCCIEWGDGNGTIVVVKYTSRGRRAWAREYDPGGDRGPWPNAIALDAEGDAYVAGHAGTSAFVMKLSARDGALRWRWLTPDTGTYEVNDMVVTRAGTSFIAGFDSSENGGTGFLAAVSPAGEMKWLAKRTDPAGRSSWWSDIALARGTLYVSGWAGDLAVGRYTAAGGETWLRSWSPPGAVSTFGTGMATGSDGSVYVVGRTELGTDSYAGVLAKWNSGGKRLWTWTMPASRYIYGAGLTLGDANDLYVGCAESVVKCTTTGRVVWRWNLPANEYRGVSGTCLAGSAALFVAGRVGDRTLVAKLRR